jgi:hypothetical protein
MMISLIFLIDSRSLTTFLTGSGSVVVIDVDVYVVIDEVVVETFLWDL